MRATPQPIQLMRGRFRSAKLAAYWLHSSSLSQSRASETALSAFLQGQCGCDVLLPAVLPPPVEPW
jgi:hypothetical protein